jgi:hypothetical protein
MDQRLMPDAYIWIGLQGRKEIEVVIGQIKQSNSNTETVLCCEGRQAN